MKINFFKYFLLIISLLTFIIIYLSFVGIETEKFNQQIKDKVIKSNKNLDISLKKVKLTLDPFKFKLNAKTVGAIIYYSKRPLILEHVKTQVSIDSFFKNKLVSSNFEVATRSILVKDLVKFIRAITNKPELLILETLIKNGHVILDLNLNFDQNGKIKSDYEINGLLKGGKIKFLKKIDFENIDFLFNIKKENFLIKDIKFTTDKVNFTSNLIKFVKIDNDYLVEGRIQNSESVLSNNLVKLFNINFKDFNFEGIKFNSKNKFKFKINNKLSFKNLKINSDIKIKKIKFYNKILNSDYFANTNKQILLNNQNLKLNYENNLLSIKGKGDIKFGEKSDKIEYFFLKNKNNYEFKTDFNIKKLILKNQKFIKNYFPLTNDQINLENHKINIKFKNNELFLTGQGKIKINKEFDYIRYSYNENNDDFEIISDIDLTNVSLENKEFLKRFFPQAKDFLVLNDHKVKINFKKNYFSLSGQGKIKIDKNFEDINYFILNEKKQVNFDFRVNLKKTAFKIKNINFKKNFNDITRLSFSGSFLKDKYLKFNNLSIIEKNNKIKINNLVLDKDYLFVKFDRADLDYLDNREKENQFVIKREEKNNYKLNGLYFNADSIITNLLNHKEKKEGNFLKNNIKINLNLNEVYVDQINFIKNLQGSVVIKNNEVVDTNLSANFNDSKKIIFSINSKENGKKITKFYSSKAKPFVKRYKFIKGFDEGYLDFVSSKKNGKSISNLKIYDFKLKELPILTKLLTLASLQGIADILTGEGIRFDEFEMKFNNERNLMNIDELYAIGPAISIMMSGYVEPDKLISLRGTLVPATTINKSISKIPLLGKILVGDKTGEGVFGVSFKIKGPYKNLETTVNPIKTLTPRFITRTLEKLKKN